MVGAFCYLQTGNQEPLPAQNAVFVLFSADLEQLELGGNLSK